MLVRSLRNLFPLSILFLATACQNESKVAGTEYTEDGFAAFSADSLGRNISALSADSMMGRKPFTEGETRAIGWLQQKFAEAGLEPGNGSSYLQDVPMVNIATKADSTMQVTAPKGNFTLKGFDDYVMWTEKSDPLISLKESEVVFAGYGVNAPERGWNDYAGLDVKGKIVLVLVNDPGYGMDSSLFKGDTMTYYGRWTYKFEEAARQGAKGCLVIHNTKAASYPFSVVQNNWNGSRLHLDNRGKNIPYCDVVGWVSGPTANKLLEAGGYDSTLLSKAAVKGFKPVPLPVKLSTNIAVTATYKSSHNVIGKITGSKHPDEYVIYTAHWDHLGIGKPDERGDSIYNGALDNASATAGLLELARAFRSMKAKPERTVIFLSVTAEEQGLWGSAYYAQNPVYPAAQTVANINMDGLNPVGRSKDIIIVGQGQSSLEDSLAAAAQKMGRSISYEQHPEAGYYYRSDHFNFAKVGIPALYTNAGVDIIGKEAGYGKKMEEEYTEKHYHRPSDEYSSSWNLDGAIDDLKLMFLVGKGVANGAAKPEWKSGSEFRANR
ncbi:MAG TPA: M28 family metallopeptidase [Flavisolibacter sp.]|nr:M28 family metallopeptidase [Flavisolibacter sp.]